MVREACTSVERAQAWLGTVVSIRVDHTPESTAHAAIAKAFSVITFLHQIMSFHDPDSDVSRLNREAHLWPVKVHPATYEVLETAERIASYSAGIFDITIARELTSWNYLPSLCSTQPDPAGRWSDIDLLSDNRVRFRRPLWIDVGGIAKGFAVDRAMTCLQELGIAAAVVNAGGDLRVCGPEEQIIGLDVPPLRPTRPCVSLQEGSLASSCGLGSAQFGNGQPLSVHIDGRQRTAASSSRFVCVAAEQCMIADALTKIVLAEGVHADDILSQFHAQACLYDEGRGWRYLRSGAGTAYPDTDQ